MLFSFSGSTGTELVADVSMDNRYLAAPPIFSQNIDLRLIPTGAVERQFVGLKSFPKIVRFSKDASKIIAYSAQGVLMIWEVQTGNVLFEKIIDKVQKVSFTSDSMINVVNMAGEEFTYSMQ